MTLIEGIGKAYDEIARVGDKIRINSMRRRLLTLLTKMSGVNSIKILYGERLDDYLTNPAKHVEWATLKGEFLGIAKRLDELSEDISKNVSDIIKAADLTLTDDLRAAIQRQAAIYKILADVEEPRSKRQKAEAKEFAAQLRELLQKVRSLENKLSDKARRENIK